MMNLPRNEEGGVDYSGDFFGREAFLTVSGQLNVEEQRVLCVVQGLLQPSSPSVPGGKLQHHPPPRRVLDDRAKRLRLPTWPTTRTWPNGS